MFNSVKEVKQKFITKLAKYRKKPINLFYKKIKCLKKFLMCKKIKNRNLIKFLFFYKKIKAKSLIFFSKKIIRGVKIKSKKLIYLNILKFLFLKRFGLFLLNFNIFKSISFLKYFIKLNLILKKEKLNL